MSGKNFMSFGDADTILTEFSNDIKSRVSTKANQGLTAQQIANAKANIDIDKVPNVATNDQTPTFLEESTRTNIASGDKLSLIFGKIKKFFSDLKAVAFSGSYNDLSDTPDLSLKADKSLLEDGNAHFQFGVDANGNYGYHKTVGGADTVIPFKTVGTRSGAITANGTYTAKTDISKDGYESVTVSVSPNLQSKTVTAGTTNVTVSPDASYDGLSSVVVQPTPSQTKSASSSTSAQTITPDSGKLLSSVSISAISPQRSNGTAATASGIDSTGPYVYFPHGWWPQANTNGNYTRLTAAQAVAVCPKEEKTATAGTSATSVTPSSGKLLSKVTVNPTPSQQKTVTASMSNITVTPDSGKLLSKVVVNTNVVYFFRNPYPNDTMRSYQLNVSDGITAYKYIFFRVKVTTTLTQYEQLIGINTSNYTKYSISVTNLGTLSNIIAYALINGSHTVFRPIQWISNTSLKFAEPIVITGKSDGSVYLSYSGKTHWHYVIPLEGYGIKA